MGSCVAGKRGMKPMVKETLAHGADKTAATLRTATASSCNVVFESQSLTERSHCHDITSKRACRSCKEHPSLASPCPGVDSLPERKLSVQERLTSAFPHLPHWQLEKLSWGMQEGSQSGSNSDHIADSLNNCADTDKLRRPDSKTRQGQQRSDSCHAWGPARPRSGVDCYGDSKLRCMKPCCCDQQGRQEDQRDQGKPASGA